MCWLFPRNAQQSLEADSNTVATDENLATTNLQQSASNAVTSDKRNTNFDQMTIEVEGGSHLGKPKIYKWNIYVKKYFTIYWNHRSILSCRNDHGYLLVRIQEFSSKMARLDSRLPQAFWYEISTSIWDSKRNGKWIYWQRLSKTMFPNGWNFLCSQKGWINC